MDGLSFHERGPVLPFNLIKAQEQGDVVFLCGAGVSMPMLPGFIKLVEDIYSDLGESWDPYPAEAEGMKCPDKFKAPDRTLNALAERLGDGGEALRKHLRERLSTNAPSSALHYDLLRLSRGIKEPRIVTTNFDTLFERSWLAKRGFELDNHCTAGMPGPGATRWKGIFHLHGRIADANTPQYTESDLVLTSAEFGDAYLRSGWASRYLYDLLRHSHVVIVGYSLNDPPTRYLFDALAADRKRFEFKDLYAIVADEGNADEVVEVWRGRQAIPLIYSAPDRSGGRDYSALRLSVEGWANYAEDPTAWAKSKLQDLFRRPTAAFLNSDWHALDWILSRRDNDRLLEEANPSSRWLEVLWGRREQRQHALEFGPWISKRLNERSMIDAVLRNQAVLTAATRNSIQWEILRNPKLSPTRRSFWLALCASKRDAESVVHDAHYSLDRVLSFGDTNGYTRGLITEAFSPIPTFRYLYSSGRRAGQTISQLANIEFNIGDQYLRADEIAAKWPRTQDAVLLRDLIAALKEHLRRRKTLVERPIPSVWVVASISDHPQNHDTNNIGQIIRLIVILLERVAAIHPITARNASLAWKSSDDQWEMRLWLHALSLPGVHPASEVGQVLTEASDEVFWGAVYQREVMRLMISRWADLSPIDLRRIEQRLIEGNER